MDLNLIAPMYRAEMTGAFAKLANELRAGRITINMFLKGQQRIYRAYRKASEKQDW